MNWINKKRNRKGFTLVELVVVIAILGILAGIAIPKLGKSRLTSQIAAHNANVRILKSAAAMYLADNPDATTLSNDDIVDYIDGNIPTPYKDTDNTTAVFTVSLDEDGNINVEPDELEINSETGKVGPKQ